MYGPSASGGAFFSSGAYLTARSWNEALRDEDASLARETWCGIRVSDSSTIEIKRSNTGPHPQEPNHCTA